MDSLLASSVDGDECLPMSQDLPDLEEQLPLPQLPLPLPMHSQLSVTDSHKELLAEWKRMETMRLVSAWQTWQLCGA